MSRHDLCEGAELPMCRTCIRNQDNLPPGTDTSGRGFVPPTTTDRCHRHLDAPTKRASPEDRL